MGAINAALDFFTRLGFDLRTVASEKWLDIALWQYVFAFISIAVSLFARRMSTLVLKRLILPWISRRGDGYTSRIISALTDPLVAILGLVGLYSATKVLMFPTGGTLPITVISGEFVDRCAIPLRLPALPAAELRHRKRRGLHR